MADGWDLHAVVSSCTTASSSSRTVTVNGQFNKVEDPLPDLASLTFNNDDTPSSYPDFVDNSNFEFLGLEEIYRSYSFLKPRPNSSSISVTQQQQTQLLQRPPQKLINSQFKNSRASSSLTSLAARSRRRKNQQTKLVRQMTHEELLADTWAWRKYGQKPIKGSLYPRNYYRCSTSKGCAARKQVEKNPSDPDIYVVSYSGEHTHPRPTHLNSLAGTTRSKFTRPTPGGKSSEPSPYADAATNRPCSSSSPLSASSFSPENTQSETIDMEVDYLGETKCYEDIPIPNTFMSEDILNGFQELRRASGSLSPWAPNSSTTKNFSSAPGGGC